MGILETAGLLESGKRCQRGSAAPGKACKHAFETTVTSLSFLEIKGVYGCCYNKYVEPNLKKKI